MSQAPLLLQRSPSPPPSPSTPYTSQTSSQPAILETRGTTQSPQTTQHAIATVAPGQRVAPKVDCRLELPTTGSGEAPGTSDFQASRSNLLRQKIGLLWALISCWSLRSSASLTSKSWRQKKFVKEKIVKQVREAHYFSIPGSRKDAHKRSRREVFPPLVAEDR